MNFWQKKLNPQQYKAVVFEQKPLLILAGAGSGKTRVLTYRTAFLILEKQISPENILLVTFTNKAAGEMKKRINNLLNRLYKKNSSTKVFAGTFHAFCAWALRRHGQQIDIPPQYIIYDQDDQVQAVKNILEKLNLNPKTWKPKTILNYISQAKNELLTPDGYKQIARGNIQEIVAKVYPLYQQFLFRANALDFDDLLVKTLDLFQSKKQVLANYQEHFKHLLIDEYQDTNKVQYQLTSLLAKQHQQLTVVGDASQSIYSWRGADFRNLNYLVHDFPNLTTINLEQNYRSTQTILDAAHAVIKQNRSHPILKLWTQKDLGEKIHLYEAFDQGDEANWIASKINDLTNTNKYFYIKKPKPDNKTIDKLSFNDIAILYRTNAQSRAIEEVLIRSGISYRIIGGTNFYSRKEIKDCLAYLRLIVNPRDLISQKRAESLGKKRFKKFLEFKENLSSSLPSSKKILTDILVATGYLNKYNPKDEQDLTRLENIKELSSVAAEFPDLPEFLENVSLVQQNALVKERQTNDDNQPFITLMTLHTAKGLEFKAVFLIGLEEGLLPHARSFFSKQDLEEERRLCYVGITRAKKHLFLTYAKKRLWFGAPTQNSLSRFIIDIPENLINYVSQRNS